MFESFEYALCIVVIYFADGLFVSIIVKDISLEEYPNFFAHTP